MGAAGGRVVRGERTLLPLSAEELRLLELDGVLAQLRVRSRDEISIMLYRDIRSLDARGPSIQLP